MLRSNATKVLPPKGVLILGEPQKFQSNFWGSFQSLSQHRLKSVFPRKAHASLGGVFFCANTII